MARKRSEDQLLAVTPDGKYRLVPNTYEGIKEGAGSPFDFVHSDFVGMYIDDEGMLKELPLNVPASVFMARALYGPVVLCAAQPDDEGDTLPASKRQVDSLMAIARLWQEVVADAARLGQDVMVHAVEATIPPPTIVQLDDAAFERYLTTGRFDA